ncbi:hypothetical protein ANCCAN_21345, partial [Ancylostoma caninum]
PDRNFACNGEILGGVVCFSFSPLVIHRGASYFALTIERPVFFRCTFGNDNPFNSGIYSNGRIRCTLHGACFNVRTGDIEDYPGFDSLFTYDVQDVNGDLVLNTTEEQLASARRTRKCNLNATCNDAPIIIVGAELVLLQVFTMSSILPLLDI